MISASKFPLELKHHTPAILKMLSDGKTADVSSISEKLYEIQSDNNKRKTRQLLEALEDSKILRCEMGKRQRKQWMKFDTIRKGKPNYITKELAINLFTDHKPVLTNLEIATALFDQIDKTTLDCVAVATNTIAMRSGLKKEKINRVVYYSLPDFEGDFKDYRITRSANNEAIKLAQQKALESTSNMMMQQALLFYRTLAQFNIRELG